MRIKPPETDQLAARMIEARASRQTQMREDARNHRRRFNSSDDVQAAATLRAAFDIEHAFKKTRPTHACGRHVHARDRLRARM